MIGFKQKGSFSKLTRYLIKSKSAISNIDFDKYGKEGVEALAEATPILSGKTAASWSYEVKKGKDYVKIAFNNSNIKNGVPIAIILQYGHGTKNGGWVQGRDYINPAIRPIFDKITNEACKEVGKV